MDHEEWRRFCNALVTLKHTFAAGSTLSVYDRFVAMHVAVRRLAPASDPNGVSESETLALEGFVLSVNSFTEAGTCNWIGVGNRIPR